jgi:hypothetical protein
MTDNIAYGETIGFDDKKRPFHAKTLVNFNAKKF